MDQQSSPTTAEKPLPEKKRFGCLKVCLILVLILVVIPIALFGGFIYFQSAPLRRTDEQVLKTYQPITEIAEIALKDNLTDKGKANFYRADPRFVNTQEFIDFCKQAANGGVEALACIAPKPNSGPFGGRQIFLLQIDDSRFSDHKFSAAAHEMLHGAFDRLNKTEKKRIEELLNQELTKKENDPHLTAILDLMKKNGKKPEDLVDELHSKFGVEFSELSPELEDYYQQYFTDRQQLVKLYREGGFNSRVRRLDELKKETDDLTNKISPIRDKLTNLQNTGNIDSYNSLVPEFNGLVDDHNALVTEGKNIFDEVQTFYKYFNPDYQPPEAIEQ